MQLLLIPLLIYKSAIVQPNWLFIQTFPLKMFQEIGFIYIDFYHWQYLWVAVKAAFWISYAINTYMITVWFGPSYFFSKRMWNTPHKWSNFVLKPVVYLSRAHGSLVIIVQLLTLMLLIWADPPLWPWRHPVLCS